MINDRDRIDVFDRIELASLRGAIKGGHRGRFDLLSEMCIILGCVWGNEHFSEVN